MCKSQGKRFYNEVCVLDRKGAVSLEDMGELYEKIR